ncbi:hypothetical protein [Paenibacillus daejeonensis]|uniref:hypothetical protein n=1 Tax=Paenibacillus daejeonensis TaxID=135193 RepID=UPI0003821997|nr:hypothetical protein [Paenibacillus daejeonensis]
MDKKISRYYQIKQKVKELEQEASELRSEIMAHCAAEGRTELDVGGYRVRIILQERKEYDDARLYEALPDPEVWRMLSKTDPAKVASLVKLNVLKEDGLQDTYTLKQISLLQVDKK